MDVGDSVKCKEHPVSFHSYRWGRAMQPFQVNSSAASSELQQPNAPLINGLNEVLCILQQ